MPTSYATGTLENIIHKPAQLNKETGELTSEKWELQILERHKLLSGEVRIELCNVSCKSNYRDYLQEHIKIEVRPWNIGGRVGWYVPNDALPEPV